jgi:hypothetical protein
MKAFLMAFAVVVLVSASAWAVEDNKANREKEADRYLKVMTVKEMCADVAERFSKTVPEGEQEAFKERFLKHLDTAAIEKAMKAALVKHLTTEEIKALADFYGSPAGKSAMKKMSGAYMTDIMPTIQAEVMKAQAKTSSEAAQNDSKPAE